MTLDGTASEPLFKDGGFVQMENSTFTRNRAGGEGGAAYFDYQTFNLHGYPVNVFKNLVFGSNQAQDGGALSFNSF